MNEKQYNAGFKAGVGRQQLIQGASDDMKAGYAAGLSSGRGGSPTSPITAFQGSEPKMKYYQAMNSNRLIKSDGIQFSFSPYQHVGGTWFGTFATDKSEEILALDKLVTGETSPVTELTKEQYDDCLKKKAGTLTSLGQSLIHSEVQSQSRPSANLAAPLNTEPEPPAPPAPPVDGVQSLELGESKMPDAAGESAPDSEAK